MTVPTTASALEHWLALGGADFDERAAAVIADLGLPDDLLHRGAAALCGGQKARLALAAVLLAQPDLLLLDEPTNDLDDDGLRRLEERVLADAGRDRRRVARPGVPRRGGRHRAWRSTSSPAR